jgi:hypothetical protein
MTKTVFFGDIPEGWGYPRNIGKQVLFARSARHIEKFEF